MTPQTYFCSECGRPAAAEELARFGDRLVCPNCKDSYAQKLREGVAPAGFVRYGGFWLRFVAAVIDGIILAIPMGIVQAVLFGALGMSMVHMGPSPDATPAEALSALAPMLGILGLSWFVSIVIGCSYETFFIVKFAATPGKMAVGVKVLRPDGSKLQIGRAIGRYFAKALSAMILCIGYIMAGFDSQKRALHDMICDTRVIQSRG
ncbi:MAG: RDD family protein [Bryobacteraceae bacterium]